MKKLMMMIALSAIALGTYAQTGNNETVSDTTEIIVANKKIIIVSDSTGRSPQIKIETNSDGEVVYSDMDDKEEKEKKKRNVHVGAFNMDLGMNYLTRNGDFNISNTDPLLETRPINSSHFALHMLTLRVNLIAHKVHLGTALTLENNRYAFRKDVIVVPDQPTLTLVESTEDYKKSKLISTYAQVPLLLHFQSGEQMENSKFHVAVGGYAGLLIGSSTKRKGDEVGKIKQRDDFNLNPVRYGVTGRIGFGGLSFYCNYTVSDLFEEGQGPSIQPITFGIALGSGI